MATTEGAWARCRSVLRRPIEEHSVLALGLLTITVLVVALVATLTVSSIEIGKVKYEADFAQAAQINPGDSVTVAGVPVGTVAGTDLDGAHVRVTMQIDKNVHLGAETVAAIKLTTLLGARYIELRPSGDGDIPDRRITLSHTEVPYDLQEVIANATTTFEDVDAESLGETMSTLASQLEGMPALVPPALANIETLSSVLAERRGQIGSLLTSTSDLTSLIKAQQTNIGELVRNGRDVLQEITSRQKIVEELFGATTALMGQLQEIVSEDQPQVQELITSLNAFLGTLAANDDLLRNTLEILPIPLRNFTNASGTGNEVDFSAPAGPLIDSWMCTISLRAHELDLPEYLENCK